MRIPARDICIVMMTALGDAVHTLPVVHSLREHDPDCRLTWIVQHSVHPLVKRVKAVDEFIIFDRSKGLRGFLDLRREVKRRHFDLLIDLQVYLKAGIVTWWTNAPVKLGFDRKRARDANFLFTNVRIPPHAGQHVQDQYFEFLSFLGVTPVLRWDLAPSREEQVRAAQMLCGTLGAKTIAINVGASKPAKMWDASRYAELARRLMRDGYHVALIGAASPLEIGVAEQICHEVSPDVLNLVGKTSLGELLGILKEIDLLVSPDTGTLHMAVALGTKVVGLFARTDARRSGPYRADAYTVNKYPEALRKWGAWRMKRRDCMSLIAVEDVTEQVTRWESDATA